jgi:hypothetical protein
MTRPARLTARSLERSRPLTRTLPIAVFARRKRTRGDLTCDFVLKLVDLFSGVAQLTTLLVDPADQIVDYFQSRIIG